MAAAPLISASVGRGTARTHTSRFFPKPKTAEQRSHSNFIRHCALIGVGTRNGEPRLHVKVIACSRACSRIVLFAKYIFLILQAGLEYLSPEGQSIACIKKLHPFANCR